MDAAHRAPGWKPIAVAAAAATLDSDPIRKIPREKFRTKINAPRARENQCINSICPHLGKYIYYDQKNAAKIGKWSGKTKIAIISSKKSV